MITGRVNSDREAVISLAVSEPQGETREVEAVIDTGYAGYLTLPGAIIAALNLSSLGLSYLTLADGSELPSDVCLATVDWDGRARTVAVDTLEFRSASRHGSFGRLRPEHSCCGRRARHH